MTKLSYNSGQAMMVATMFFLVASITIIFGLAGPVLRQQKIASALLSSRQSYFLAEAGIEDVAYRLVNGISVDNTETLSLSGNTATTLTADTEDGKEIVSSGSVFNAIRRVRTELLIGDGIAFHYGIHVGSGGFTLSNNAGVIGNVYSNSSITGTNGAYVTGSAIAVGTVTRLVVGEDGVGDARAQTVTNSTIEGNLYCQTGSGNNKPCNTSSGIPSAQAFPITDQDILEWKEDAEAGGVFDGNKVISGTGNILGPMKINGNLTLNIGAELTISGTLWVTGNILLNNNASVALAGSYGANEGMVIVDGTATLSNGSVFDGSGEEGSYIMLLTTSSSGTAVNLSNNTGAVIIYAPNGTVQLNNNAQIEQVTAKMLALSNNATIQYEQGVINASFISGPSGGFDIVSWEEVE